MGQLAPRCPHHVKAIRTTVGLRCLETVQGGKAERQRRQGVPESGLVFPDVRTAGYFVGNIKIGIKKTEWNNKLLESVYLQYIGGSEEFEPCEAEMALEPNDKRQRKHSQYST